MNIIPEEQWFEPIGIFDTDGSKLNPWNGEPYQNRYKNAPKYANTFVGYNENLRNKLPIYQKYKEFIEIIATHPVVFVTSGTGSGKTVMVPRFLEHLYGYQAKIIVTIPKQESVRDAALFQAKINDVELGQEIGYQFRGEQKSSSKTKLLFATDGLLVRKLLHDPTLSEYQAVIVDEAHERNIQIDFLLYLLRDIFNHRTDFRLIIMSAEAPVSLFQKYFKKKQFGFQEINAGAGTSFPIVEHYLEKPLEKPEQYLPTAIQCILNVLKTTQTGDILVFVTSSGEAIRACRQLHKELSKSKNSFIVKTKTGEEEMILFCGQGSAGMSNENKKLLLEANYYKQTKNKIRNQLFNRRVTFVTNVAESSLTLEGYDYVIDNGFALVDTYDAKKMSSHLLLQRISRAQQTQRRGRVGRMKPGVAFYLYTKKDAEAMLAFPISQMQRSDLSESILNYMALPTVNTLNDLGILLQNLIEPPPISTIMSALQQFYALGWIVQVKTPKQLKQLKGDFTERGKFFISAFQGSISACASEAIFDAWEHHVVNEVCGILALLDGSRGDLDKLIDKQYQTTTQMKKREKYTSKEGGISKLFAIWMDYTNRTNDKWFETMAWSKRSFHKVDQAYRRLRFQTVKNLQIALENPNKQKQINDFRIVGEEKEIIRGGGRKQTIQPETESNVLLSFARGYWIYMAHKQGTKYKGCLAEKQPILGLPENSGLKKLPEWIYGVSWGGFQEKLEIQFAQVLPTEQMIHPNMNLLIKQCLS